MICVVFLGYFTVCLFGIFYCLDLNHCSQATPTCGLRTLKRIKFCSVLVTGESRYCGFFLLEHVISTYKTQK